MNENDCDSCGNDEAGTCPNSKRPCGHHCNCSWTQDECCWCGKTWGEEDLQADAVRGFSAKTNMDLARAADDIQRDMLEETS